MLKFSDTSNANDNVVSDLQGDKEVPDEINPTNSNESNAETVIPCFEKNVATNEQNQSGV